MKNRLHFLDNLRTFCILGVVVLHSGLVYEFVLQDTWIVSDPAKNGNIGLIRMYLDLFIMFTLFFISGYFIPASVSKKSVKAFIKSKANRIMLPWFLAILTLIPAYKYIFLLSRGLPQESWYTYFHLFKRIGGNPSSFADNPVQNWLWFLPVLFLFQIIYLFLSRSGYLSKINISLKQSVIIIFVIGVLYSMSISLMDMTGWYHSAILHFQRERFLLYFMVFLLGSKCYNSGVFEKGSLSNKWYVVSNVGLTLGLLLFTVIALNLFFNMIDPERDFYFLSPDMDRLFYYMTMLISMFSFLHVLIYSFHKWLNKTNRLFQRLSQYSYNVYIIHVVVIGLIALIFLKWEAHAMVKFNILWVLAFAGSNALVYLYFKFKADFKRKVH